MEAKQVLDFLLLCGKLKETKRTGWVNNGVKNPESVADHMYRMAIVSMLITGANVDGAKLIKMAVVHDLAEAVVGDITPFDGVSKEEKRAREEAVMRDVRDNMLAGSPIGKEIYDLWLEYDDGASEHAKVMKQIDKFEMIVQAYEYESAQGKDLSEFFSSTQGSFSSSPFTEWVEQLQTLRNGTRGLESSET